MSETTVAVIPARFQSTRFPGKPLVLIAGKPMIQHVYEKALQVPSLNKVIVATDHSGIFDTVQRFGGQAMMTRSDHATGTDRIVEAIQSYDCSWVLNIQGDEPLIHPEDLETLIQTTQKRASAEISTLIFPITEEAVFQNPNVVKVVLNHQQEALYFSRAPIPYPRTPKAPRWKHLGIYLYKKKFLTEFQKWPQSQLEQTEQLEQLRILEKGKSILCVEAMHEGMGVDVPEDLYKVETRLRQASSNSSSE